eukprot:scaffold81163_cov48-Phaeocystis_antarctica.AAC.1
MRGRSSLYRDGTTRPERKISPYLRGVNTTLTSRSGRSVKWVSLPTSGWPGGSARAKTCSTRPTHLGLVRVGVGVGVRVRVRVRARVRVRVRVSPTHTTLSSRARSLPGPAWSNAVESATLEAARLSFRCRDCALIVAGPRLGSAELPRAARCALGRRRSRAGSLLRGAL